MKEELNKVPNCYDSFKKKYFCTFQLLVLALKKQNLKQLYTPGSAEH